MLLLKFILATQKHKLSNIPIISVGKIKVLVINGINIELGVGKINHDNIRPPSTESPVRGIIALFENCAKSLRLNKVCPEGLVIML